LQPREELETWVIEPRGAGIAARTTEVWRSRHLVRYFAHRALQRQYRRTLLGWPWLLIRPLVPIAVSTFVFHGLVGIQTNGIPYFLYLLVGTSIWRLFSESLMWATRSLQMNRALLTKLYFPRIILPVASTAPAAIDFVLVSGIAMLVTVYFLIVDSTLYVHISQSLGLSVLGFLLCLMCAQGLGLFAAVFGAETRDLRFTLPYGLQVLYLITPILYPASLVPEDLRWISAANPLAVAVELFRAGLFAIPIEFGIPDIVRAFVMSGLFLSLGIWFFTRSEASSVDRL
jgi:lipopolysaccharide transport system permease protein